MMKPIAIWLNICVISVLTLSATIEGPMTSPVYSQEIAMPASCSAPEYHQFDFWVGDWDAFDAANPVTNVARTRVHRILDGCVLLEDYEGANGLKGQSFSLYDASRKIWHQSWVTNRGQLLVIEGKLEAGEIVLAGVDHATDGKRRYVRGTWKSVKSDVRETAVTSTDGGKTWQSWFDLLFRPHKP